MSVVLREHIELLRQYFLSDDAGVKKELLESIPPDLRKKVLFVQEGFEKGVDSKSIATSIGASNFEEEIDEIQSIYQLKKLDLDVQDFEKDIKDAITPQERESLKKKLIEFEENGGKELSDLELKSAFTQSERESLKKKFQIWDNSLIKGAVHIYPMEDRDSYQRSAASYKRPTAVVTKVISFQTILKYAVAACFIVAIGIGIYQFTVQDSAPENMVTSSSEEKPIDQKPIGQPVIETVQLAEVSTKTNSYPVLKSGLGYGEVEEKAIIIENNQEERILSIQKAISIYKNQLDKLTEARNSETDQTVNELRNRISALQEELTQFNTRESQYVFDGKVLTLFVSSVSNENELILYDSNYYLNKNNKFFKLTISKKPQLFLEETDPNVLKALDKIIFNAE